MASEDWRSKLGALMGSLPQDTETEAEETNDVSTDKPIETSRLDIIFEKKGRGGKTATIISGFTIDDETIAALASEMKQKLGTGGSARGGEILIQGDRRNDVLKFLTAKGIKARII